MARIDEYIGFFGNDYRGNLGDETSRSARPGITPTQRNDAGRDGVPAEVLAWLEYRAIPPGGWGHDYPDQIPIERQWIAADEMYERLQARGKLASAQTPSPLRAGLSTPLSGRDVRPRAPGARRSHPPAGQGLLLLCEDKRVQRQDALTHRVDDDRVEIDLADGGVTA